MSPRERRRISTRSPGLGFDNRRRLFTRPQPRAKKESAITNKFPDVYGLIDSMRESEVGAAAEANAFPDSSSGYCEPCGRRFWPDPFCLIHGKN